MEVGAVEGVGVATTITSFMTSFTTTTGVAVGAGLVVAGVQALDDAAAAGGQREGADLVAVLLLQVALGDGRLRRRGRAATR